MRAMRKTALAKAAKPVVRHVNVSCQAFQQAIGILGRPWNASILGALQGGTLRYSELAGQVAGVGDKILSARLKDLEKRGIIDRRVDPGPPVRVGYALTDKGEAFSHVAE